MRFALHCAVWLILPCSLAAGGEVRALVPVPETPMPAPVREVLENYCHACHEGSEASGGVDLTVVETQADLYRFGRDWNKVLRVVGSHEMPPRTEAAPSDEERQRLTAWIDSVFRGVDCAEQSEPGRVTVRRLNRVEYGNTMRDLLGVEVDAARDLPRDPAGEGFDNQGDTLFIPPVLMEKYLDTTKRILSEALATDSAGRDRLIVALPDESHSPETAARMNLETFLPRAFRRPIDEAELEPRVLLVTDALSRGESFEQGLQAAYASALLSPHCLFRIERNQAPDRSTEAYAITDHELATRLSYFLWSTMPDDELARVADEGRLHEPEVLRAQVARMLADAKSAALAEDFAAQWLGFRDLRTHEMDIRRFGGFSGIRDDLYHEVRTFFDTLFRENRSLLEIVDCDYVFVNAKLAAHYGLPEVEGNELREVALADRRRGGVLGMGSTLAVTSYPTRTSPILRGKWVLENLLGITPPPPPPDVKEVSKNDELKDGLTLRQRLEAHRSNESCASCHAKMDPLGFSLENYDGMGQWRDEDNGNPVDAAAVLPDGTEFSGPAGLKDVLIERQDLFLRHLVEKMLTYALGRPVDYYDECTVRDALARLVADEHRAQTLVLAIVESYPFRHKKNAD